jgi:hypothetical protein
MRFVSKLLLLATLLLVAQPLLACPECQADCVWVPPPNVRCKVTIDGCTDGQLTCTGWFAPEEPMALQWAVASVEVTRPDQPAEKTEETKTVVAEAAVPAVPLN